MFDLANYEKEHEEYEVRQSQMPDKYFFPDYCVSTIALSIEHYGGNWYETYIFPARNCDISEFMEIWGERYRTAEDALDGHLDVISKLNNNELRDWDNLIINPIGISAKFHNAKINFGVKAYKRKLKFQLTAHKLYGRVLRTALKLLEREKN